MSPATDRVLAEGLTCSKTIIRVHLVRLTLTPASLGAVGTRSTSRVVRKLRDFVMISAAERNRAAALWKDMMEKLLNSHPLLPVC